MPHHWWLYSSASVPFGKYKSFVLLWACGWNCIVCLGSPNKGQEKLRRSNCVLQTDCLSLRIERNLEMLKWRIAKGCDRVVNSPLPKDGSRCWSGLENLITILINWCFPLLPREATFMFWSGCERTVSIRCEGSSTQMKLRSVEVVGCWTAQEAFYKGKKRLFPGRRRMAVSAVTCARITRKRPYKVETWWHCSGVTKWLRSIGTPWKNCLVWEEAQKHQNLKML